MNKKKGFTLVELLIVVMIIGILAVIALPNYQKSIERAYTAEAKQVLSDIYNAKRLAKVTNRSTPTLFSQLDVKFIMADGAQATSQTFSSKNFKYTLSGGTSCGDREPTGVLAEPIGSNLSYSLFYCPGKLQCIGTSATCASLGFTNACTGTGCKGTSYLE